MVNIDPNQLIGIMVSLLVLPPSWFMVRSYIQTGIKDFALFGVMFIDSFLLLVADPLAGITNLLFFYQLHHVAIDLVYFMMLVHALGLVRNNISKYFLGFGTIWFILLVIMTLQWTLFSQPDKVLWFGFSIPHSYSSYYPLGAGFLLGETIVYSTAFRIIGDLFRVFVVLTLIATYLKITIVEETESYKKAKRIWLCIWVLFLTHALLLFPWFALTEEINVFLLIAGGLLVYHTLRHPKAFLLTQQQVDRLEKSRPTLS